jgi:hypothetical protein
MNVQDATLEDVPILAIHHRKMLEEIWGQKGLRIDITRAKELESAYFDKIGKQIPVGVCKAWVTKTMMRLSPVVPLQS